MQSSTAQPSMFGRGTSGYRAPELLDLRYEEGAFIGRYFSRKSDIWAVGCILYELATTGTKAFWNDYVSFSYARGEENVPQLTEESNPKLRRKLEGMDGPLWVNLNEIIKGCLDIHPKGRPSAAGLLDQFQEMFKGVPTNGNQ